MNLTTRLVKECVLSGQKPRVGKRIACNACEDTTRFITHQVRMGTPAIGTVAGLCANQFDNSGQEAEHVEAKRKTFPLSRGAGRGHAVAYRPFNRKELNLDEAKHVCNMLVIMLGLSDVELGKIVLASPQVISQRLRTTEAWIQSMRLLLNLSIAELKKVVLWAPRVLGLSFDENVKPWLQSLRELLGLSDAELKKLVLRAPALLCLSIEENVKPSLQSLRELLGLSDAELKKVVLRSPTVLGLSFEENVKPSLQSLRELLGLSDAELKKLVLGWSSGRQPCCATASKRT
ncbi:unnamed protein product [Prorocentrum cordatum]|uniref:Uncharacterized protein n=1 Tax=Prorocentrum cordatum TaxID=2364126 RepID=A0ABN9VUU8_9DINO|nr:unnamed protein product [Polarella glacialis]